MANERPVYCGYCGSIVQAGDTFCGVCGSRIPPDAQEAAPTQQIPTLVQPPPNVPTGGRSRPLILVAAVGALLVLSLAGVGAMALTGLGPGAGLLGDAERKPPPSDPPDAPDGTSESPTSHTATPNSPSAGEDTVDLSNDTSPPAESTESTSFIGQSRSEGQLRKAVEDYYEAVHRGDWAYTYDHLDSMTRAGFTRDEWFQKNEYFAGRDDLGLSAIYVEVNGSTTDPVVSVTVYRTLEDGTSIDRDTFFVWEDGGWQHRFGQEENDLYMPEASYEEFVEARQ